VCGYKVGQHYADIEHVVSDITVSRYGDVTFNALYTARHNGGLWTPAEELLWGAGERPTIFSSLNGHASYTRPGDYRRYWGVATDRCDYGIRWDPDTVVFLPTSMETASDDLKWTLFKGQCGDGHVTCFGGKAYMTQTEVNEEYGSSLNPFKWRI
jgi:hypothetical protein